MNIIVILKIEFWFKHLKYYTYKLNLNFFKINLKDCLLKNDYIVNRSSKIIYIHTLWPGRCIQS